MKTTRYQFETTVQGATATNINWLKDAFKGILESDKDYTRKADYIGLSINSIDDKVVSIDDEIQELQQLKKNLKIAKDIAITTGAEVFKDYGIEKLEGAGISSITLSKPSTTSKLKFSIDDPVPLIEAGFYKKVLDEDQLRQAYEMGNYMELMNKYVKMEVVTTSKPVKLKINKRRSSVNNTTLINDVKDAS